MRDRKNWLFVGLALISGLVGSLIFNLVLFSTKTANAAKATGDIISASEFRLVDKSGDTRGRFFVHKDGSVNLHLLDPKGTVKASAFYNNKGSGFGIYDDAGEVRGTMGVLPEGTAWFFIYDEDGEMVWGVPDEQ